MLWVTFSLLFSSPLLAQVQSRGKYRSSVACPSKAGSIRSTRVYSLPEVNNLVLLLDAESEESSISFEDPQEDQLKPYKFAEAIPFDLDIKKDGVWEENKEAGYKVWRATVTSKAANSLGLVFDDFYLPHGGELYVVGQDRILGAFIGDVNNKADGKFSTMPLPGEALLLEYYEPIIRDAVSKCLATEKLGYLLRNRTPAKRPASHRDAEEVRLAISRVTHGFRPYTKNFGDSGSCNVDVACEPRLAGRRQINSVAMLLTQDGTRVCTGAFINNVKRDGRQLFLTAKHCMNEDPSNFIVVYNYQVDTCGQRHSPPDIQSTHGMTLLHSWAPSDFAIAEIREKIPDNFNVYMAGWDLSPDAPENIYTIHHPTGDVKKISYYQGQTQLAHWLEAPRMFHWKVPTWTKGSTERGSSGAPMFNSRGLIVGHLHGGSASCYMPNGYDNFGGLFFDWASGPTRETRIRDILNPDGKQVTALKGEYLAAIRKQNDSKSSASEIQERRRARAHHRHRQQRNRHKFQESQQIYTDTTEYTYESAPSYHYQASRTDARSAKINPRFQNREVIDMIFHQ